VGHEALLMERTASWRCLELRALGTLPAVLWPLDAGPLRAPA